MDAHHKPVELPLCPHCAKAMELTRTWRSVGGLPQRSTFECNRCNIIFTEIVTGVSSIPERVSALHHDAYNALQ
jgi:hypothetical protein